MPRPPHNWSVSPSRAIAIQKKLALMVRPGRPDREFRYIAGVDAAYLPAEGRCVAGVVLWDRQEGKVVEIQTATLRLTFPYIPGLLTFREAPAVIAALRRLRRTPDCLLCDGQGIAHPRRCGIATHLGLVAGLPAIGCAKSRLIGTYCQPGAGRGASSTLMFQGEVIGAVLRTRERVKPVFVSVGHDLDLVTAINIVLDCGRGYRLPETTRLADHLVRSVSRR